jgi:hypothetical protein
MATTRNYDHTNWLIVTLGNIVIKSLASYNGARICSKKSGITQ